MSTEQKQKQKTVEVTLTQPHTHAGRRYQPGAKLQVLPHQKAFLAARNKIEGADTAEPAKESGKTSIK